MEQNNQNRPQQGYEEYIERESIWKANDITPIPTSYIPK